MKHRPKRCKYNNKDKDNSPETVCDNNLKKLLVIILVVLFSLLPFQFLCNEGCKSGLSDVSKAKKGFKCFLIGKHYYKLLHLIQESIETIKKFLTNSAGLLRQRANTDIFFSSAWRMVIHLKMETCKHLRKSNNEFIQNLRGSYMPTV